MTARGGARGHGGRASSHTSTTFDVAAGPFGVRTRRSVRLQFLARGERLAKGLNTTTLGHRQRAIIDECCGVCHPGVLGDPSLAHFKPFNVKLT